MLELIDWFAKLWDRKLLELKFHHDDAEAISQIPFSHQHTNDALFWLHSTEGVYSVKTGYHLARELKKETDVMGEGFCHWEDAWCGASYGNSISQTRSTFLLGVLAMTFFPLE